jgi:acetyl esterase/lipase
MLREPHALAKDARRAEASFALDPELAPIMAALAERSAGTPRAQRGDWATLRRNGTAGQEFLSTLGPQVDDVSRQTFFAEAADGSQIELRWYSKTGTATPGSAVVFAHGGGMVIGTLDLYDAFVSQYVSATSVPFLSVGYRLAPEAVGPTQALEVLAGLTWLHGHAFGLGVDPSRIALMGDSAGGGIAAATAIFARDQAVPLARQILIYPMLDDRNLVPDPNLEPFLTWTYDDNYTGWRSLLGQEPGTSTTSPYCAPARLTDAAGLAPAYIEVGELDAFRAESVAYAAKLSAAGVSTELHVHPGAPHGFDRFAPASSLTHRATTDRLRILTSL